MICAQEEIMQANLTQSVIKDVQAGTCDLTITDDSLPGFQLRVRPSGAKSWIFRYRIGAGPQQRLKLGNYPGVPAAEARKLALIAAADVAKRIDPQSRKRAAKVEEARRRASTLAVFINEQYEPWAKTHLATCAFQIKRIKADFKEWLERPMITLSVGVVEKWRAACLLKGNQPVTVNRNLQRLYALLSKALEWKVIDQHPFAGTKQLKTDRTGRVRYLEEDEEEVLRGALLAREKKLRLERDRFNQWRSARGLSVFPPHVHEYVDHLHPIVLLALNTGLRRSELFHLKWKDVNLKTKWLVVVGRTSKNKQTRRVPLNREAVRLLDAWKKQCSMRLSNPHVFHGNDDKPLTTITTAWRTLRKQAGLIDFNFHDLRHHFASRLVQSGVDLNTVRELLGHADIKMVLRYAHLAPAGLANAVEKVTRVPMESPNASAA
jgi:integrase